MAKQVKQRATRADVAQEAGTSVAVVSYVVNNGPRPVAPATRERVLAAIKKTGYRPNNVARALASGTTKTYGLVVPNIDNAFIASLAHELQQEALANDMVMLLGDAGDDRKRELQLINNLLSQQINGIIYVSVDRHPYIDVLQASGTPCVMLDRVDPAWQVNVLRVDEREAARQVTSHLLSHGYQEVGVHWKGLIRRTGCMAGARRWQNMACRSVPSGSSPRLIPVREVIRRHSKCYRAERFRARCLPPTRRRP